MPQESKAVNNLFVLYARLVCLNCSTSMELEVQIEAGSPCDGAGDESSESKGQPEFPFLVTLSRAELDTPTAQLDILGVTETLQDFLSSRN